MEFQRRLKMKIIFILQIFKSLETRLRYERVNLKSVGKFFDNFGLRKKCPYSKLFWSVLSRLGTEYGHFSRSVGET